MRKMFKFLSALSRLTATERQRRADSSAAQKRTTPRERALRLESLEDRRLLASLLVTSAGDTGAAGELRTVINIAENNQDAFDTITFAPDLNVISLKKGPISISKSLSLDGDDRRIRIEGYDGNIFDVHNSALARQSVTLKGLTLTGAHATAKVAASGSNADNGGAIELSSGNAATSLTIENCVITDNSITSENNAYPAWGGGICAQGSQNTLVIKNSSIVNNSAIMKTDGSSACGGGIYAAVGNLTIENSTISENNVESKSSSTLLVTGGGVYIAAPSATATATITGATIENNTVLNSASGALVFGGGIYENGGVFTLAYSTVGYNSIESSAETNGGINVGGAGVAYAAAGSSTSNKVAITNTTIVGNSAASVASPTISGGGLYLNIGETASVNAEIGNSTVVNNKLVANGGNANNLRGGGVYFESASATANLTIYDSTIASNLMSTVLPSDQYGSALYLSLSNPTATVDALNTILTGTQTAESSQTNQYDVYCNSTSPTVRLYYCVYGNLSYEVSENPNATNAAVGCLSNQTTSQTFASWNETNQTISLEYATAKINAQSLATVVGTFIASNDDGFYYYNHLGDKTWWKAGSATTSTYVFDENADLYGMPNQSTVYEASQNNKRRLASGMNSVRGYYVGAYSPTPEYKSTIVTTSDDSENPYDNEISFREAVRYATDVTITFADTVTSPIYLSSPVVLDKNLTIASQPTFDGGASTAAPTNGVRLIEIAAGKTVEFQNATFQNAYSEKSGGAILNRGTLILKAATFTNNASGANGGAIANLGGSVTISEAASFSNNVARNGGAIYTYGELASVSISTTDADVKATFVNNQASGAGGAIAIRSGSFAATNVAFSENKSNNSAVQYVAGNGPGGAIYNAGTASVVNGTFQSNEAVFGDGGAISNAGTGMLTLNGVAIGGANQDEGNLAVYGGGIVNSGYLVFSGEASTISYNKSTQNGGGIANSLEDGSTLGVAGTVQVNANVTISDNKASRYGGGLISVENTTVQIGAQGFLSFDDNDAVGYVNSSDVSLYCLNGTWPSTGVSEGIKITDFTPAVPSSCPYDCGTILPSATDSTIIYNYSFEIDGTTQTLASSTLLSPSQLGITPGVYTGTVELTNASGESLGFNAVPTTLEIQEPEPAFDVDFQALADGQILRLQITSAPTTGAVCDWIIAWGDGTVTTSDSLSTSLVALKQYETPGEYAVSLTADGTTFGLGTFAVAAPTSSNVEIVAPQTVAAEEAQEIVAAAQNADCAFAFASNATRDFFTFAEETAPVKNNAPSKIDGEREKAFAERAETLNFNALETKFEFNADSDSSFLSEDDEQMLDELFNEIFATETTEGDWDALQKR